MVQSYWIYNNRSLHSRFIFMVQSYNSMLMMQNYNFVFQIFLTLKKKQWCKAVGSSITSLSAIVSIRLRECCLLILCLLEASFMILPVLKLLLLKLLLFWHRYFILLIFADIVFCCFRLHIYWNQKIKMYIYRWYIYKVCCCLFLYFLINK